MWLLAPLLACTASDPATDPTDTGTSPVELTLRERCFPHMQDGAVGADYTLLPDGLELVVPEHCLGTDHQDIGPVGLVVFLGDSITAGTPPTHPDEYYTAQVVAGLEQRFGAVEVADCAEWGARIDDLLVGVEQGSACVAEPTDQPTLVVFTIGGNDMVAWGEDLADGDEQAVVEARFEQAMVDLETTLTWLRGQQPTLFPAGLSIVFTNVYEYTDSTNEVGVCPLASVFQVPEQIDAFAEGYANIGLRYAEIAVRTGSDMVFLQEEFCGHGFFYDDPENPCYRGDDAERWFDDTCIHPTPTGHARIAEMVLAVVDR